MRFSFFSVKLEMFNQVKCKFIFFALNTFALPYLRFGVLNNFCGWAYGLYFMSPKNLRQL